MTKVSATRAALEKGLENLNWYKMLQARMLTEVDYRDPISPICFQAKIKVLGLTFKALCGLGPAYLKDCLLTYKAS